MAAKDGAGERRRTRSLDERKRIVEEAIAPGVSVAAVARRHGLNANLIFKWIRRSREEWRDRRREPAKDKPVVVAPPERGGPAFVPAKLLELDPASAPPPSDVTAKPARRHRRGARRGAMEISLPNGAAVSLDAEVAAEALRRVLSALFVRVYPRETQEMVLDAHERAFAFFKGACARGIYDNMKTAVETIFVGKDRQYNRRFLQMCSHHLVEPVACTPASGWEKGQVENQVGLVRERFFTPRLRFKSYGELNAWLLDKCLSWAKAHAHPERPEQTIWEVFEEERPKLIPYRGRFDEFHALPAAVSKTCLVRFDNNKYSVSASAIGRPVDIPAYADRIVIRQEGRIVAEHRRSFARGETVYDPWHYVPVLARKPGALRNGAPFKDWVLPMALDRVRRKLAGSNDGDRQMVKILAAVLTDGLAAVEAACAQALAEGVHSADVVINILARQRDPGPAATILTPDALHLRHAPVADCARYDQLRSA